MAIWSGCWFLWVACWNKFIIDIWWLVEIFTIIYKYIHIEFRKKVDGFYAIRTTWYISYIYIYIYMYHTMTDLYTAALLPTKTSSDNDSGFRHSFGAEASLPITQSAPAVTHDTTRLCWTGATLWDWHIPADSVRTLSWIIFFIYFQLSDGKCLRLVKNTVVELVMKPRHPTSMGNTLVIQQFLTHCSRRSSYFFQFPLMCAVEIFFKRDCELYKNFFLI